MIIEEPFELLEVFNHQVPTPRSLADNLGQNNIKTSFIVQQYINDPLLIDFMKFEMRFYVLVTSCNPLTIFVHK